MLIIPPYTQCVQKCHQRSFNNGYPNKKTRFKRALGNFYRLFLSSQIFYILISLEPLSTKVAEFSLPVSQIDYFQPHPKDSPTKVNQTWKPCSTDVTLTSAIAPPPPKTRSGPPKRGCRRGQRYVFKLLKMLPKDSKYASKDEEVIRTMRRSLGACIGFTQNFQLPALQISETKNQLFSIRTRVILANYSIAFLLGHPL